MRSSSSSRSRSTSRERRRSRSRDRQKRSRYENDRHRKDDHESDRHRRDDRRRRETDSHRRSRERPERRESTSRNDKNDGERWPNDKYLEMGRDGGSSRENRDISGNRDRKGFGYHKNNVTRKDKNDDFMDARRLQREAIGEEGTMAWAKSPPRPEE